MSAERTLKNIARMRDMRITHEESQWILGACAGTTLMTVALDRLAEKRANPDGAWTGYHLAETAEENEGQSS